MRKKKKKREKILTPDGVERMKTDTNNYVQ